MKSFVRHEKRKYHKPQLTLVPIDFSVSTGGPTGHPGGGGDPWATQKAASTKTKPTTPFGGSKPNYK